MRMAKHKNYIIEQWEDEEDLDLAIGMEKDQIINHDFVS